MWIIQDEKLIPELQDSIKTKISGLDILSFHDLKKWKKEPKMNS